jgi:hypothetical protein
MTGPASHAPKGDRRLLTRATQSSTAIALTVLLLAVRALVSCGGTTGREDLAATTADDAAPATSVDAATDATVDATQAASGVQDAGAITFDVTIEYADADRLPKLAPGETLDGGSDAEEAAAPAWMTWPACACDSQGTIDGVSVGIPADAGACSASAMVWTQRPECDTCYRTSGNEGNTQGSPFPPCCDLRGAGNSSAGPGQGQPLFDLCVDLYTCALQSGCWSNQSGGSAYDCYCGDAGLAGCKSGNGNGVCKSQYESAFQVIAGSPDQGPAWAIANATAIQTSSAGYAGAEVMNLFLDLQSQSLPTGSLPPLPLASNQCGWACQPQSPAAASYVPPPPSIFDAGAYTKTESILSAASPSCFACLKTSGCLDDDRGDMNNECEDLAGQVAPSGADAGAGQSLQDLCYGTLQCILGSTACLDDFGAGFPSNLVNACTTGDCKTQEENGMESVDPTFITTHFNDSTLGAGVANRILNCAYAVLCDTCFGQ